MNDDNNRVKKLHVGKYYRMRSYLIFNKKYGNDYYVESMHRYAGKIVKIESFQKSSERYRIFGSSYWFTAEMMTEEINEKCAMEIILTDYY